MKRQMVSQGYIILPAKSISDIYTFPNLGLSGGILHFQMLKETSVYLIRRRVFAASDLILHCLPMFHTNGR